LDFIDRLL